jgi:hypothetical protein
MVWIGAGTHLEQDETTSAEGQGRQWPTGEWHSRSTPSSGNAPCVPALTLRAMKRRAEILHLFFAQANPMELSAKIFGP